MSDCFAISQVSEGTIQHIPIYFLGISYMASKFTRKVLIWMKYCAYHFQNRYKECAFPAGGPFNLHGLTSISAWVRHFIQHFTDHTLLIYGGIKFNPGN